MKYAFRVQTTEGAFRLTTEAERDAITGQTVKDAEKHDLKQGDYAFFHVGTKLRVVVDFANQQIHIMTTAEYVQAGLPDCPHVN